MQKNETVIIQQCENGFILAGAPDRSIGVGVCRGSEFVFNEIEQVNQFLAKHFSKPENATLKRPD